MKFFHLVSLLILVSATLVARFTIFGPRVNLPAHLLGHPIKVIPNMISPEVGDELTDLIKEMKDFPTNAADLTFYKTLHEHIGEAVPIGKDGTCSHPYLVPSSDRTLCVLPGRIDVGRHYLKTGGVEGLKERYEDLVSRVQSFGRYMFNPEEYPVVDRLFRSPNFQAAATNFCPKDKQVLDPFQFNFIMQVPGQTVALHVDAVYFWGATRFHFPQWLLAVMQFSGLFQKQFVDQIQVVGYLHRWESKDDRDGAFVYWTDNGDEGYVPPSPLLGNIVDGSKVVHASMVYKPHIKAPVMDKSKKNVLRYVGNEQWQLTGNDNVIANYTSNDLRISIVYRARCFASEEEKNHFNNLPENEVMKLDTILDTLKKDMVEKGHMTAQEAKKIKPLDLALKLMDVYVTYPKAPKAWLPINYCMVSKLVPSLKHIVNLFC